MKHLLKSILLVLFACGVVFSQETKQYDKVDELPKIKGGMKTLLNNILYPETARKAGVEGKVIVEATVDKEGNVIATTVLQSIGSGLDESAVNAIKNTKFIPAKKDNKPVPAKVTIPVQYKLDGKKNKEK